MPVTDLTPSARLRHRVTIVLPPDPNVLANLDERGQVKGSNLTVASSVPAEIVTLSGMELMQAHNLFAMATLRVTVRRDSKYELTTKHRFLFNGRTINIGYVNNAWQQDHWLVCLCMEEAE